MYFCILKSPYAILKTVDAMKLVGNHASINLVSVNPIYPLTSGFWYYFPGVG
jgi:hypothetical protein